MGNNDRVKRYTSLLNKCSGCKELPFDVAPPQAKGKSQFQCPAFAKKEIDNITPYCWGMHKPVITFDAVSLWNEGEKIYREKYNMVPRKNAI